MKKPGLFIFSVIVVIALMAGIVSLATHKSAKPNANKTTVYTVREACTLLTASIAKQYAGSDAKQTTVPDTKLNGAIVSYCSYTGTHGAASLTIHSATNKASAQANALQFSDNIPVGAQTVPGYGSAGYWDPQYSQFSVLDHNNWYTLTAGSFNPSDRSLSQTKQYANLMIKNF